MIHAMLDFSPLTHFVHCTSNSYSDSAVFNHLFTCAGVLALARQWHIGPSLPPSPCLIMELNQTSSSGPRRIQGGCHGLSDAVTFLCISNSVNVLSMTSLKAFTLTLMTYWHIKTTTLKITCHRVYFVSSIVVVVVEHKRCTFCS